MQQYHVLKDTVFLIYFTLHRQQAVKKVLFESEISHGWSKE
jgi:hypothetical protein